MLTITIPAQETWSEEKNEFETIKSDVVLHLEHSLFSLKQWEAKYHKPFLSQEGQTLEETLYYIKCMCTNYALDEFDDEWLNFLKDDDIKRVTDYIDDPMTATTINNYTHPGAKPGRKEIITAEIIYYWMIAQNIPTEYQYWHLNQLITLIQVCNIKNDPNPQKMSRKDILSQNAALNKARRARMHSKG